MMLTTRACLALAMLLPHVHLSEESALKQAVEAEEGTCVFQEAARSANALYLGNEDAENALLMEFPLSKLTSYLSSFDFRTFDSEGIIFYGDIGGENNWFILGLREKHLEVQMNNENGQMVLSKFGPNMSDGTWKKVSVDRNVNTIEVRVDGELVISLMHYVKTDFNAHSDIKLRIVLGDFPPHSSLQILRPLKPALDGCMRHWSWVQKEASVLANAMEHNKHRHCFDHEEAGAYFPGCGYAEFEGSSFLKTRRDGESSTPWTLTATLSFRPLRFRGILFSIHGESNTVELVLAMNKLNQMFTVSLVNKNISIAQFDLELCKQPWIDLQLTLQNNQILLQTPTAQLEWELSADDFQRLEHLWMKPTTSVYIGGAPGSTKENYFAGCLKMTLQGKPVEMEQAKSKHPHIRAHSCPKGIDPENQ